MTARIEPREIKALLSHPDAAVVRRNLQRMIAFRIAHWIQPCLVVFIPYAKQNGLSVTQAAWAFGLFGGTGILLDVLSGMWADRIGRKWGLLVGAVCMTGGSFLMVIGGGAVGIFAGCSLVGAGHSFISGSDSALVYDTLIAGGWDKEARDGLFRWFERITMSWGLGIAASVLLTSGLLAEAWGLRAMMWAQVVIYGLLILLSLSVTELTHVERARRSYRDMFRFTRQALYGHRRLSGLIFYLAVIATLADLLAYFIRPLYGEQTGVGGAGITCVMIFQDICFALGVWLAKPYEKLLGFRKSWASLLLIMIAGLLLLTVVPPAAWLVVALIVPIFAFGVSVVNGELALHAEATSDVRATVLSVKSWVGRCVFLLTTLGSGWVIGRASLQGFLWCLIAVFGLGGAAAFFAAPGRQSAN